MSETPIIYMPEHQGRLTDREIENKVTEAEMRGDFDLWNEEIASPATPPIWEAPELNHNVVQPPVFELKTISHEQQLQHSIEFASNQELFTDIDGIGARVVAERNRYMQAA